MRRRFLIRSGAAAALALSGGAAAQPQFFRIGTGGPGGTYFPVGGMIATAISEASGGGVRGLVATAVASNGSLANIAAIASGNLEAGLSQADVAHWAWSGTGLFAGQPRVQSLRLIANLYPESVHIVTRRGSGIRSVADLAGKRVSLDEPGSGTLIDARIVLAAHGIAETDIRPEYLKMGPAADRLRDGAIDAFFVVGGWPIGAIAELAASIGGIDLVPVDGGAAEALLAQYPYFARDSVPAETYPGTPETPTLAVGAQLITDARIGGDLVAGIVRALWNDTTRKLLDAGHPKGRLIRRESALVGAGIPLHAGAERFYRDAGMLK